MGVNRYLGGVISADPNTPTVTSASGTWTLAEAYQNIGNWPMAQSQIQNSLRFNSADSAYLSRTPATAGNRRTFTLSFWIKSGSLAAGTTGQIMGTTVGTYDRINFGENSTAQLSFTVDAAGTSKSCLTPGVYRDPSAWYHFVVAVDTTQATDTNRVKIYANGVQQTLTGTFPTQNYQSSINNNVAQYIGSDRGSTYFLAGYLANINFIDGLALDADYFGFTDANGIWQPKQYKGAYGTNGFYLDFLESDVLYSTTTGGKFSTTGPTSIFRSLGNDSSAYFSGMTISGDFDFYWTYGTGSGSLTPGDAYIVGVVAASYQASFNYDNAYIGGASSTLFYTLYGSGGFYTRGYVNGTQTDASTSSDNPGTTTYVRMTRSGSTLYVYQGTPGSWTLKKTFTGTFSGDLYFFVGSGDKNENISLNNVTFASINGGTRTLTDAGTIAGDASGNGNGWGTANIQTSGSSSDWMVDTPTNYGTDTGAGGEVRGNYCTLNPLDYYTSVPTNGNLDFTTASAAYAKSRSTIWFDIGSSDGWYAEFTLPASGTIDNLGVGVADSSVFANNYYNAGAYGIATRGAGGSFTWYKTNPSGYDGSTSVAQANGQVIGIAVKNGKVYFSINGSWILSGNPATESNPTFSGLTGNYTFFVYTYQSNSLSSNFGQLPFSYAAPSGFKALCTQNLSTPTILDGADYFQAVPYQGNASTQTISVGFQPDFVWIKGRSFAGPHNLFDAVRGATKVLYSNLTNAEATNVNTLTAFTSNGFSLGNDGDVNRSADGGSLVAWNWKASNAAPVTNTAGAITSTVSANTTSGFSIGTFSSSLTKPQTIGHGLGATPSMIIIKRTDNTSSWTVYHASAGTGHLLLNATDAYSASNYFPSTSSTTFTLNDNSFFGGSSQLFYAFAPVAGYSAFGSYTGNGSADGPFVYTGFRPNFLLVKKSDGVENWIMLDGERNTYNVVDKQLLPNTSDAEGTITRCDFLSNGFKVRAASTAFNSGTMIYAAFASNPFKLSRAR